jgi:hypothetical protein
MALLIVVVQVIRTVCAGATRANGFHARRTDADKRAAIMLARGPIRTTLSG